MISDKGRIGDGFASLEGGMDGGRSPSLISSNQCSHAGNVTFRGGFARNRPEMRRCQIASSAAAVAMLAGRFQGSGNYEDPLTGAGHLIVVSSGRIYKLTPPSAGLSWAVIDITGSGLLSAVRERVHMVQADKYLVIQDGSSRPFIWDSTQTSGRPSTAALDEVPVGTGPMAYGNGRLWVAKGRGFVAGDIFGGSSGVLKFTENSYLHGGGEFRVTTGTGDITAMRFVATPNTALGVGALMVFTVDAVFSVQVPMDRYDWYALADPIQRVILINNGAVSHHSTELVNGDIFFRSLDGIRSIIQAVRDFSGSGNSPISREVSRTLDMDSTAYIQYASSILFDNRFLVTTGSVYSQSKGPSFTGIVALDFDLISGLSTKLPMAYDGVWSLIAPRGPTLRHTLQFAQLVKGRFNRIERAFGFVINEMLSLELWEFLRDGVELSDIDYGASGGIIRIPIESEIQSRSFSFEALFMAKSLESADLWIDEVSGTVNFHVDFHPDQHPCWQGWHNWSVVAEFSPEDCSSLVEYQKQYRPRMRIGRPTDADEPAAGKRMNYGWEFAVRIKWAGRARLKMFRMNARHIDEEPYSDVVTSTAGSHAISCDCF